MLGEIQRDEKYIDQVYTWGQHTYLSSPSLPWYSLPHLFATIVSQYQQSLSQLHYEEPLHPTIEKKLKL
jgi:hypothetical protein